MLLNQTTERKRGEAMTSESSEDEDESDDHTPFVSSKPHQHDTDDDSDDSSGDISAAEHQREDVELAGFIEEDGDAVATELPPEFSMNTFQDLVHHFKIICQLFVHLAVQRRQDRRAFMERSLKGLPTYVTVT